MIRFLSLMNRIEIKEKNQGFQLIQKYDKPDSNLIRSW